MPAKLSTHVLDLTTGKPATGLKIELWSYDPMPALLKTVVTNADGRTDAPLLAAADMAAGTYELVFLVKDYFGARGVECTCVSGSPMWPVPIMSRCWSRRGRTAPTAEADARETRYHGAGGRLAGAAAGPVGPSLR
jgi:5-hydroxyisourate hydrolase-like protein (transthyretin family)